MEQRFVWTKRAIERLTWMSLDGESWHAIAAAIGCEERTARKMQWELNLAPRSFTRRPWAEKEKAMLRRLYANTRTDAIARQLGRGIGQVHQQAQKLGLKKSIEVIRELARERSARPDHGGVRTRFAKGDVPANKGARRPGWAPGRMAATQFKKGERSGAANHNWRPVGTILPDHEGYLRIKVREYEPADRTRGFGNVSVWPLMQRHVWMQQHGPIEPNYTVCFKDGNRNNCVIENLELVSRGELMRRNTIHNYPTELRNTIMLLGAVKRKVREKCQKTQ